MEEVVEEKEEDMMVVDDERDSGADGDLNSRPPKSKSGVQTIRLRCLKQNLLRKMRQESSPRL